MTTTERSRVAIGGTHVRVLLAHLALYGLADILVDAGVRDVRSGWSAGMDPAPWVAADRLDDEIVGDAVRRHAILRAEGSWLQEDVGGTGTPRGLMSPRHSVLSADAWSDLRAGRERVLDDLTAERRWNDLRYLAALGEPAHWSRDRTGRPLQDDGASRLEMQPRNQGSEFVGSRLRKVAAAVASRSPAEIIDGLTGRTVVDEVGQGRSDSRTPTGFASPGPTDNAVAWCALWGLGQLPTVPRVNRAAATSGHLGRSRHEWFYVPVWVAPWRSAKVRRVLASADLADAAGADLHRSWSPSDDRAIAARERLAAQGVEGIVRFPVERFGSDKAPERRAMRGEILRGAGV
jgi:CRISPR-associated protein Csb3